MIYLVSLFAIFFQFLLSLISVLKFKQETINLFGVIICFSLYLVIFGGITKTTDWDGYVYIFNNDDFPIDYGFRYLSDKAKLLGFTFTNLFQLHVLLIGSLLSFFISRFTTNNFFVISFVILILFVPLANQIRFFLSISLFLNATYFLCVRQKKVLFLVFTFLSIITHFAIIPLFLFVPLFFIKTNKKFKKFIVVFSLVIFIIMYTFLNYGIISDEFLFNDYLQENYSTSFLGSLLHILPILLLITFAKYYHKSVIIQLIDISDKKLLFLYRLTLFSFVFIPAAFLSQIILWRFCVSLFFIWILFFLYITKNHKLKKRLNTFIFLFFAQWFYICYKLFVPLFILNSSDEIDKIKLIINSIQYG